MCVRVCVCICVSVCVCVYVCVCVCVRCAGVGGGRGERDRERDRKNERERARERWNCRNTNTHLFGGELGVEINMFTDTCLVLTSRVCGGCVCVVRLQRFGRCSRQHEHDSSAQQVCVGASEAIQKV